MSDLTVTIEKEGKLWVVFTHPDHWLLYRGSSEKKARALCERQGWLPVDGDPKPCQECGGRKMVVVGVEFDKFGMASGLRKGPCPTCQGEGR